MRRLVGPDARPEAEIFKDLETLCTSPGYIHAVAYFCWRDNLIRFDKNNLNPEDIRRQRSEELIRSEISTLIGLVVRHPIDMSLPPQEILQGYVQRTEVLLSELHRALQKPWFEGWAEAGKIPDHDPFNNAAAMREPIFYGGESAYDFQYLAFASLKYRADDNWLKANKGFHIADVCRVVEAIAKMHLERQRECAQSLFDKPAAERTFLPAFEFVVEDVVRESVAAKNIVEQILNAFGCGPNERNTQFTALSEFNITNSKPILRTQDGSYLLFQHYSLFEAVYEAPFFWMNEDKNYAPRALQNRGRFTEGFAADRLESVFGANRVLRNVDIYKGKDRFAEADSLVLYGAHAIVVQAKSKRLTIEARKGNDFQLKDDFKKAVQDAYDQASLCIEALSGDGFKFVAASGDEIVIAEKPRVFFPICIVSDHYPALAFQARQFLKSTVTTSIQSPLVIDIFALDVFTEMLDTPLNFLNYLTLRARFDHKLMAPNELTILSFHLRHNLWIDSQYDMASLEEDFAAHLDIAMLARRRGYPGKRTPEGILTRFEDLTIGRLLEDIEAAGSPQLTGVGLLLLQLDNNAAKYISDGLDKIIKDTRADGSNHDLSITAGAEASGLTVHCNALPDDTAKRQLSAHCKVRKYDTKANSWYGLLLDPPSSKIRAVLTIEEDWQANPEMDSVMKSWPKRAPVPLSDLARVRREKIGRNELCPCGSGKKYKKCCIQK